VDDQANPGPRPETGREQGPKTGLSHGPGQSEQFVPDGVLVIGVGNDLRGDDGAGRAVVEELDRLAVAGVHPLWSHQLVPELAERIARARLVVFVDAVHPVDAGARPLLTPVGVVVRPLRPSPPAVGGHQADPGALLGLTALAGLRVPEAYVVAVPSHDLDLGAELSPPTRAAVSSAVTEILRLCSQATCPPTMDPPTMDARNGAGWIP
jgi:hydrogenase maturation protease